MIPSVFTGVRNSGLSASLHLDAANAYRRLAEIPCATLEEWQAFRKRLRQTLRRKIGLLYDGSLPLDYREVGTIHREGYRIIKIAFRSQPAMMVPALLYVPEGTGPFPAVLNLHGHWPQGKIAAEIQMRGHILAGSGYVVLSADTLGAGERCCTHGTFRYHGDTLAASLFNTGTSPMGALLADNMRGIDLLRSLPYVDRNRIGVTGGSGGGNQTMWLAAMDERVKAAMAVVSVGTFESYVHSSNCVCELLPDGLTFTEESAILALVAPRALKICNGIRDDTPSFYPSEMLRSYDNARPVFRLYGVESHLANQIFDLPHGYWPDVRRAMLGWFDLHLKGIGDGLPKELPAVKPLPEEELMVFPVGQRPAEIATIPQFCRALGQQLIEKNSLRSALPDGRRKQLAEVLRLPRHLAVKSAYEKPGKGGWRRFVMEFTDGRQLPLVMRPGAGKGIRLVVHRGGKAGAPLPETEETLVLADLTGQGECAVASLNPCGLSDFHDLARHMIWLGKRLMGQWTAELGGLGDWLKRNFPPETLTIHGVADCAVAALFATVLYPDFTAVVLEDAPVSYLFAGDGIPGFYSSAIMLPGFLAWGDIPDAVALSRARVTFISPRKMDGTPAQMPGARQ